MAGPRPQIITDDRASGAPVIDRSLNLSYGNGNQTSAYLTRTNASSGNRRTWTFSGWIKRINLRNTESSTLLSYSNTTTSSSSIEFGDYDSYANKLRFNSFDSGNDMDLWSAASYRDPGSWYHIVESYDSTQDTDTDRVRMYVNGEYITEWAAAVYPNNRWPGQNEEGPFCYAGSPGGFIGTYYWDSNPSNWKGQGYLSNFYLIDGKRLDASYFGYTDPLTNIWRPKSFIASVDAPSLNKGITWSSQVSGSFNSGSYDATKAFDGNLTGSWSIPANNNNVTWTLTTPITARESIRLKIEKNGSGGPLFQNGVDLTSSVATGWLTLPSLTLTTLVWGAGGAGNQCQLMGVQVDGEILIDGQDDASNYGVTGFHLPFDGNSPIGEDQSGNGNDWESRNFGGSVPPDKATGAQPILNTINGGKVAVPGVRGQAGVAVTVYNSKYYLDGAEAGTVSFVPGQNITFDTSNSTVSGHPFRFATAADAAGSTQYTSGSVTGASEGTAGAATTITLPSNAPSNLYYYCTNHSGMGGLISIGSIDSNIADPYASKCVFASPCVGVATDISAKVNCTTSTLLGKANNANQPGPAYVSQFYGVSSYYRGPDGYDYWYYETGAGSKVAFGSNDFTIELWFHPLNLTFEHHMPLLVKGSLGANNAYDWRLYISSTNASNEPIYFDVDGGPSLETPAGFNLKEDRWYHVAICKDATNVRMYVDGTELDSAAWSGGPVDDDYVQFFTGYNNIGASGDTYYCGYLQDIRCYSGAAKYTSNFIPASTNPSIVKDSPSGVVYGSELATPEYGAVGFGQEAGYLTVPENADWDFGTGDYTAEAWVYMTGTDNYVFATLISGSWWGLNFWTNNSSWSIRAGYNSKHEYTKVEWNYRRWYHVAVARESGTSRLFLNGELLEQLADTDNLDSTGALQVGRDANGWNKKFGGFISNARIVKGTALYTANFTPSKSPLTNITNTKLLCCQGGNAGEAAVAPTISGINDGTVWSNGWATPSGGWHSSGGAVNSFDGSLTTYTSANSTATSFKWTNPGSLSGALRIYADATNSGNGAAIKVNGSQVTTMIATQWYDLGTFGSGIDSIEIVPESGNRGWVYAIEVAGTILVDPVLVYNDAIASSFNPFEDNINLVRGKESGYCTYNELDNPQQITLSDGNLAVSNGSSSGYVNGNISMPPGQGKKWYWEVRIPSESATAGECYGGIGSRTSSTSAVLNQYAVQLKTAGDPYFYTTGNTSQESVGAWSSGQVLGLAFDPDAGTLRYYRDGRLIYTHTSIPTSGVSIPWYPAFQAGTSATEIVYSNFGQKPFKFSPPEGYKPLCLANLPSPGLTRPEKYFTPTLYSGSGSGAQDVSAGFKPDMVWIKSRNNAWYWNCYDSVRGSGKEGTDDAAYYIGCNDTAAQSNVNAVSGTQFQGFYGNDNYGGYIPHYYTGGSGQELNTSGATYVGYCWKAGGGTGAGEEFWKDDKQYASAAAAGVDAGDINPSGASINTQTGFSIIKYSGTGSNATLSHGLDSAPNLIMIKCLNLTSYWWVYHSDLGATKVLYLNSTDDADTNSAVWNDTEPTATNISLGTADGVNGSGNTYVAYCWHDVPGVQKFGQYVANNNADGPYASLGFKPALICIKSATTSGSARNWALTDSTRSYANVANHTLAWNLNNAESGFGGGESVFGASNKIDLLSNGFKIRDTGNWCNESGATYIYMAWAESPYHNLYGAQSNAR